MFPVECVRVKVCREDVCGRVVCDCRAECERDVASGRCECGSGCGVERFPVVVGKMRVKRVVIKNVDIFGRVVREREGSNVVEFRAAREL
jgi:hypothetical protein